jgi:ABC-type phosphate/phosphonate transport system substrate-binding protein
MTLPPLLALAAAVLAALPHDAAGGEAATATVRVGLVGSLFRGTPEPLLQAVVRPFKSLLEVQTGMTGEIVAGGDAADLGRQLKTDGVQLGVFHGFEFAWARVQNPDLKPLLVTVCDPRCSRALLVVRADSKAASPVDLHGQTIAFPLLTREHCRLFLERRCGKPGVPPEKVFREVQTPADSEDALDAVLDNHAQGAVIDGGSFQAYARLKPARAARLRILVESETFPGAVVAYQAGSMSDVALGRFRDGMIDANKTRRGQQLLQLCRINAFEAVPADFEAAITAILKAYPPPAK